MLEIFCEAGLASTPPAHQASKGPIQSQRRLPSQKQKSEEKMERAVLDSADLGEALRTLPCARLAGEEQ